MEMFGFYKGGIVSTVLDTMFLYVKNPILVSRDPILDFWVDVETRKIEMALVMF